ncbi:hypothetical protein [Streptomyces sp. NPDC058307]|uniref:hypothetical protein n=1 Tax=Streptomyces sp. NPDC058307 TaxID=3346439 RepID=UPI0036E39C5A
MATTERHQTAVPPESLELGTLAKDLERNKVGEVMGYLGADRVQLRPISGGTEWDAFKVRPLTAREKLSLHLAARDEAARHET